jgi:AraC-like DNA-binding protein
MSLATGRERAAAAAVATSMRLVSQDPDEVVHSFTHRLAPHRMRMRGRSQKLDARLSTVALVGATLADLSYGADVDVAVGDLNNHYLVHVATGGTTQVVAGNRTTVLHAGNVTITCPGEKPVFQIGAACHHVTLRLARSAVEIYFGQALDRPITRPVVFAAEAPEGTDFCNAWRSLLLHIREQATVLPHLFDSPALQNHYSAALLELLFRWAPHSYSDALEREKNVAASPWHVRRARAIIESRLSDVLSVAGIAREVGVSVRSLQHGFQRSHAVTPLEYIRQQRLERLHASLQSAQPSASVTELMLDHGVLNFGRFAQYYRSRYGCRPSDTLRKQSPAT